MFDFSFGQIAILSIIILLVMGPKDLPRAIKAISEWTGKARGLAREFRSGLDDMVRESELKKVKEEMEAQARKAEAEVTGQLNALDPSRIENTLGTGTADGAMPTPSPDYYANQDWDSGPSFRTDALRADQRRKKPARSAAKPHYKQRLLARPDRRAGAAAVPRRVRP